MRSAPPLRRPQLLHQKTSLVGSSTSSKLTLARPPAVAGLFATPPLKTQALGRSRQRPLISFVSARNSPLHFAPAFFVAALTCSLPHRIQATSSSLLGPSSTSALVDRISSRRKMRSAGALRHYSFSQSIRRSGLYGGTMAIAAARACPSHLDRSLHPFSRQAGYWPNRRAQLDGGSGSNGLSLLLTAAATAGKNLHAKASENVNFRAMKRGTVTSQESAESFFCSSMSRSTKMKNNIPRVEYDATPRKRVEANTTGDASFHRRDIKVVSFDFTGTLAQVRGGTEDHYLQALKRSISEHPRLGPQVWKNLRADERVRPNFTAAFSAAYKLQMKAVPNFGYGKLDAESWWEKVIVQTFEDAGVPSDLMEVVKHDLADLLFQSFSTAETWELYPEVHPLIRALNESGVVLGIVSNFDMRLRNILQDLGISDYFQFVVTSAEVGVEKPKPAIFKEAMYRAGITHPEEMIHVGDTVKTDVFGPLDMGMPFVYVQRHSCGNDGGTDSPQSSTIDELLQTRSATDEMVMRANTVSNLSAVLAFLETGYRLHAID